MASRPFQDLQTLGAGRVVISGRFAPNGSSAPTAVGGRGFTVSRTGTGTYVVNLQDTYPGLLHADARLWSTAATGVRAHMSAVSSPVKTITILTVDGTNAALDVAAAAGTFVTFYAMLNNSTIAVGG